MSFALPTPDAFPAFPYDPPYPIQVNLMRHLYESIEQKKVTIVESPTGTGKTLSLLCASLTWLSDERERATKGKLDSVVAEENSSGKRVPAWVAEQSRERLRRELEADEQEYRERLGKAQKKEMEMRRKAQARVLKRPRNAATKAEGEAEEDDDVFLPEDHQDEADNISLAVKALMAKFEKGRPGAQHEPEAEPTCTKIYYASRTHSQLSQVLPELQKLKLHPIVPGSCSSQDPPVVDAKKKRTAGYLEVDENEAVVQYSRTVSLGSRKQLCINDKLREKVRDLDEACRELLSEKGDKRCPHLPPIDEETRMLDLRDQILATPKDIEDLAEVGRASGTCPYFGSRRAIPQAELVTLPYNLLLQKSAREALGIDLTDQIVIVDEAHNLIPTLLTLSTTRLSYSTLVTSLSQVSIYVGKFRNRLAARHMLHLKRLVGFLSELKRYLSEWKGKEAEIMTSAEFVERLGRKVVGINMLEIEQYLKTSKVARKISGYCDKQAEKEDGTARRVSKGAVPPLHTVEDFMLSLTGAKDDGRIVISTSGESGKQEVEVKYQLLNPAPHFQEVVESARSVILAGGTMSPISDVVNQLFTQVPSERISSFSCGHIIPPSNMLALTLSKGPRGGELEFKAAQQGDPQVLAELGQIVLNFANMVPDGMVMFFPSYGSLHKARKAWESTGMLEKFSCKKTVFFEPEDSLAVESTLQDYAAAIRSPSPENKRGALLFAVIGAKLSEGLNFSDNLARAVLVVGLPFANLGSPELKERLKYVKRLEEQWGTKRAPGQKDAAAELYENMCMNAVNQSIGRAMRHRNDWAALILLDRRYSTASIKNKLPGWIGGGLKVADGFGQAVKELGAFYRGKRT